MIMMMMMMMFAGMHLWHLKYSAFIHIAQMKLCRRLIVVPLSTFHRLAETIRDPPGELTFLFFVPRSGSTLLVQVHHCICTVTYLALVHWIWSLTILPLPLPLSSALDFRPLRPFGCSLVCHHKKFSGSNV